MAPYRHPSRVCRSVVLTAAATLAALPAAGTVAANAAVPARAPHAAPAADAAVRAAHFSPTTPGVDVYLSRFAGGRAPSKLWLSKIGYGSVSKYQPLTPGLYTVAMRRAGAPASSRPMLTWTLNARAHAAYTLAGVGAAPAVRGVVLKDDLAAPPRGQGRVRVVQAASRAPLASVTARNGAVIADRVRFGTVSDYAAMPARTWTVRARAAASGTPAASAAVTVRAGQVTSILLLDAKSDGIVVRTVLDSSSPGVMPRSSVDAGAGGTADTGLDRGHGTAATPAVLAGVALLLVAGAARRRRTGG